MGDNTGKSGAQRLLPTTRSQVSGHRFMRRRVEHGLIYGDIRMIHDPLAARRRAAIFGLIAVALLAAGSGLFAWLKPNPDPGSAGILRATDGSLYVRVEDVVHPVTNLTSARLIVGSAEEPHRIGDERLTIMQRGVPLGIPTAPAMFAAADSTDATWSACSRGQGKDPRVTVVAGTAFPLIDGSSAVLATHDERDWLITRKGRAELPSADDEKGRVLRRSLGIDGATPRWEIDGGVLGVVRELPAVRLPHPLPKILRTESSEAGAEAWALTAHGGVQQLTEAQLQVLTDAGAAVENVTRAKVASYPDANPPMRLDIPDAKLTWLAPEGRNLCATQTGETATAPSDQVDQGSIELSGDSQATHFAGLSSGAVGVDTGHSYHVISASGQRHKVKEQAVFDTIGASIVDSVPWSIITLLPEGPELTRAAALTATY